MNKTVETLKEARRLLVETGWTQGSYKRYDDHTCEPIAYCAIGAVNTAVGRLDRIYTALTWINQENAINFLKLALPPSARSKNGDDIVRYNDRKGRSKKRIIQLFDDAIKLAEEQSN